MVWPFRSRKKVVASAEKDAEGGSKSGRVTMDNWSTQDCKICVTEEPGYMCKVSVKAKLDCPPKQVYDLLVDPDNSRFFSCIRAITYRKVIKDNGWGVKKVEVEQAGAFRFLVFTGTIFTRLFVSENRRDHTVEFKLAEKGFMKDFRGKWIVRPFNQAAVNEATSQGNRFSRFAQNITSGVTTIVHRPEASLLTLEQCVAPAAMPPKGLRHFAVGAAGNTVRSIIDDLKTEIQRVKDGKPIPKYQLKKLEKAKTMKKSDLPEIVNTVASLSILFGKPSICDIVIFKPWYASGRLINL